MQYNTWTYTPFWVMMAGSASNARIMQPPTEISMRMHAIMHAFMAACMIQGMTLLPLVPIQ